MQRYWPHPRSRSKTSSFNRYQLHWKRAWIERFLQSAYIVLCALLKFELTGCINDVHNIKSFLIEQYGFQEVRLSNVTNDPRFSSSAHAYHSRKIWLFWRMTRRTRHSNPLEPTLSEVCNGLLKMPSLTIRRLFLIYNSRKKDPDYACVCTDSFSISVAMEEGWRTRTETSSMVSSKSFVCCY